MLRTEVIRIKMFDESEPWEKSVPANLISAVEHLRKAFDDAHWGCRQTTKIFCYSTLHAIEADDPAKEYFNYLMHTKARVGAAAIRRLHDLLNQGTPPSIFKAFFDLYCDGVSVEALLIFQELSEIGRANQRSLGVPFLDWAEAQTTHVIRAHRHLVNIWIRDVCDKWVYDSNDDDDEQWFWRKWQAPRFILMTPSRGQEYEPAATWERYDPATSSRLLDSFARDYVLRIEVRVRKAAGEAALVIAKEAPQTPADTDPSTSFTGLRATAEKGSSQTTPNAPDHLEECLLRFSHTDDYRSIRYNGIEYPLTVSQAAMIQVLHRALQSGHSDVPKARLLSAAEAETSEVRFFFRNSPLWGTLIGPARVRGFYRLHPSKQAKEQLRSRP